MFWILPHAEVLGKATRSNPTFLVPPDHLNLLSQRQRLLLQLRFARHRVRTKRTEPRLKTTLFKALARELSETLVAISFVLQRKSAQCNHKLGLESRHHGKSNVIVPLVGSIGARVVYQPFFQVNNHEPAFVFFRQGSLCKRIRRRGRKKMAAWVLAKRFESILSRSAAPQRKYWLFIAMLSMKISCMFCFCSWCGF